ncbi:MAG: 4-hydroxybenzoate octaprenyltransferase [Planctomycetota bacterium]|jgi:4-hydroxybenzoate polyprenyltransferase
MIKISHSVFALPFALGAAALAFRADGAFRWKTVIWIVIASVAARTLAMAQNRLADARLDATNPRTAQRAIPAGRVSRPFAMGLIVASAACFVAASGMLNPLCFKLSPIVLVVVLAYPYTKRFTWLCHFWLGAALGLAPVGAWVAVRGSFEGWPVPVLFGAAVMLWTAGFDCIYACQDAEHDRRSGLSSIPAKWGIGGALAAARLLHALSVLLLAVAGLLSPDLGVVYQVSVAIAAGVLIYENSIVSADDLSRVDVAFFTLNGLVSLVVGAAIVLSAVFPSG